MYNKYTYDFSGVPKMNMNLNIQDCFEEVDRSRPSIDEMLRKINDDMIASMQKVEPVQEPVQRYRSNTSRLNRYKK